MSDLIGGGPSASAGNGRRPQPPPANTGSPSIKGPRDIMRERNAREARRKAEQEHKDALERDRAEEDARLIAEDERRRSAERRAAAAATAAAGAGAQRVSSGEAGQRGSGGTTGQRVSDNSQRSDRRSGDRTATGRQPDTPLQGVGRGGTAVGGGEPATSRPRPAQSQQPQQQQQPRPVPSENVRTRPVPTEAGPSDAGQSSNTQQGGPGGNPTRSSFPHAFERWETLSAHWEGLTSFWIRRLEDNSNVISRDPLSQQLSRQVTDLSAAGANLFHAVVELQRLRASSERKFQRWFFETRAEQERAQEIQADLQRSLEDERAHRATAVEEAVKKERERSNADKQLAEMKRELQISKEEARRAWEELGRREQEERERTASLREGQPTLVGGVQVVPMMQGVPSRHGSARDRPPTRDGPYTSGTPGAVQQVEGPADSDLAYQEYTRSQREPVDPFVESQPRTPTGRHAVPTSLSQHPAFTSSQEYSQAPAVQPASTSAFYQQRQGTSLHPIQQDPAYGASVHSEGALSEEEYEIDDQGHFILDANGNKIRYRAPSEADSDEYNASTEREREIAHLQRYGQVSGVDYGSGATTTAGRVATSHPTIGEPVDYSGQAYGTAGPAEWAAVPRHHHPTRLSDVLEEDERSRTSASQVSRTRGD